jgi:hypothetical protein
MYLYFFFLGLFSKIPTLQVFKELYINRNLLAAGGILVGPVQYLPLEDQPLEDQPVDLS